MNNENYQEAIGDLSFTFFRMSNSTLSFQTPMMEHIKYPKIIPGLNYKGKLTLDATKLTQTPEAVINDFKDEIKTSTMAIENVEVKVSLNKVLAVYKSNMGNAIAKEKKQLAIFYEANRQTFEEVIYFNPDNESDKQ